MVSGAVAAAALAVCALTEWVHLRRCRRLAHLAFGPAVRPRRWIAAAAVARVAAVGALCWGLLVLSQIESAPFEPGDADLQKRGPVHHLIIALDVSPSMHLVDAGPKGDQRRAQRGSEVVRSILERINLRRTRTSVVAFYTEARPVVVDTVDLGVVTNILDDLPLEYAFRAGKTNLYEGIKAAAELARPWAARSATLIVVSDGDTLPGTGLPVLPASLGSKLVLGVGNANRGTFIDGHSSRQDLDALRRLTLRLGGIYHDVNVRHVPTAALTQLDASLPIRDQDALGRREAAIAAVLAGAVLLAWLTLVLSLVAHPRSARQRTTREELLPTFSQST
jgi:Ca-activated chloride channel family protein